MIDRLSTEPSENECEPCGICDGTGEVTIHAHEEAGRIIDEQTRDCICQIRDYDVY